MKQRYVFISVLLAVAVASILLIIFRTEKETPETAIRDFYSEKFEKQNVGITFSKSFEELLEKDISTCKKYAGPDLCGWGASGDVYLDAQEYGTKLTFENTGFKSELLNENKVRVQFNVFPEQNDKFYDRELTYFMVKENEKWVVDDILYGSDNVTAREWINKEIDDFTPKDPDWTVNLKNRGFKQVNICGNRNILNTKKSVSENFFFGVDNAGYVFTDLPDYQAYKEILKTKNLEEAKREIEILFSTAVLWKVSQNGVILSLNRPMKIESSFTATIKDCVEGKRTTAGNDCSRNKGKQLEGCCGEKFTGPEIIWDLDAKEYILNYSPDPSVSLRIPGDETRFCHVTETFKL